MLVARQEKLNSMFIIILSTKHTEYLAEKKAISRYVCSWLILRVLFLSLDMYQKFVISQLFYGGHIHNYVYQGCVLKDIQSPCSL